MHVEVRRHWWMLIHFPTRSDNRDAAEKPVKGILVDAMTEYRPTARLTGHRTDANGRYVLSFRTDLTTLAKHRGVIIKPILAGSAEDDFGRSGELSMLLREDETADLSFSERTAILGKSTVASFVLKSAATVEGDVVGADGKALPSPSVGIRYPGQRKKLPADVCRGRRTGPLPADRCALWQAIDVHRANEPQ